MTPTEVQLSLTGQQKLVPATVGWQKPVRGILPIPTDAVPGQIHSLSTVEQGGGNNTAFLVHWAFSKDPNNFAGPYCSIEAMTHLKIDDGKPSPSYLYVVKPGETWYLCIDNTSAKHPDRPTQNSDFYIEVGTGG